MLALALAGAVVRHGLNSYAATDDGIITVRPRATGEALVNSAMGWTMHFYSNIHTHMSSQVPE